MTMTATSNGHGSTEARVRQVWLPDMTGTELAQQLSIPESTARYWVRKLRAEVAAATPGPVAAAEAEAGGRGTRAVPRQAGSVPRPEPKPKPAGQPVKRRRDPWQVAAVGVVLVVGLAVSYSHIVHLALLAGGGWWAWVMPLPLDGMALVSIRHLARERRYLVAWLGVAVGAVGSLTANVLAIDPSLADMRYVRWGFAALPPIAVVLCGHLLDRGSKS